MNLLQFERVRPAVGRLVLVMLTLASLMKTVLIALLLLSGSASVWAGGSAPTLPLPDAGSSILLLGLGVTAVGFLRRAFRR